jgi:hypothetical protein
MADFPVSLLRPDTETIQDSELWIMGESLPHGTGIKNHIMM